MREVDGNNRGRLVVSVYRVSLPLPQVENEGLASSRSEEGRRAFIFGAPERALGMRSSIHTIVRTSQRLKKVASFAEQWGQTFGGLAGQEPLEKSFAIGKLK